MFRTLAPCIIRTGFVICRYSPDTCHLIIALIRGLESGAAKCLQETMYCLLSMVSRKIQVTVPSAITRAVITGFCPLKNLVFHCRKSMYKIIVRGAEGNHWQKVTSIV